MWSYNKDGTWLNNKIKLHLINVKMKNWVWKAQEVIIILQLSVIG